MVSEINVCFKTRPLPYLFARSSIHEATLNLSTLKSGGIVRGTVGSVTKRKTNSTVKKDIILGTYLVYS